LTPREICGYTKKERKAMRLTYTYTVDDGFFVGHLDDYPEYTTQGENREDFENALREIYAWITDGTLTVKNHKGILEVAE
jgi:predicted RNase H-like HicB family nuclease